VLVASVAFVLWAQASAAETLSLSGPNNAVGDGKTPVALRIVAAMGTNATQLIVETNGGQDSPIELQRDGQFALSILPPRVAEQTDLVVSVRKRGATAARHVVRLRAATFIPGETRGTGALDLRVPKRMLLGSAVAARISAKHSSREVIFYVSAGSVGDVRADATGRISASYSPPADRYPQRIVVAAVTKERDLIDHATIDLYASPSIKIQSVPDALVRVLLDSETFGPFRTDRTGGAVVAVEAPPGAKSATVVARDAAGFERSHMLALDPPALNETLLICPDGSERAVLISEVLARPTEGRSSVGLLGAPTAAAPNVWVRDVSYTKDVRAGTQGSLEWNGKQCEYQVPGEAPTQVRLTLDAKEHVATAAQPVLVRVALKYRGDRAARRVALRFKPSVGRVTDVKHESNHYVTAQWHIPGNLQGARKASLKAFVQGQSALGHRTELALRTGPVARLSVDQGALKSSGANRSYALKVEALDAFGNPVERAKLVGSGAGSLSDFRHSGDGYHATYTLPAGTATDVLRVTDTDSGVNTSVALQADGVGADRHFQALVSAGYLTNFGKVRAPSVFAAVGVRPGWIDGKLLLGLGAGFYRSESTEMDSAGFEEVQLTAQAAPILARATVELSRGTIIPEVGAEGGIIVSQTEVRSQSTGKSSAASIVPAIGAVAGVAGRLPVGQLGLALRYTFAPIDDSSVNGNLGGLGAMVSYALDL
jgi:hypothetical protein